MASMNGKDLDDLAFTLTCPPNTICHEILCCCRLAKQFAQFSTGFEETWLYRTFRARPKIALVLRTRGPASPDGTRPCIFQFIEKPAESVRFPEEQPGLSLQLHRGDSERPGRIANRVTGCFQPATTALQVALVDLLTSFGIRPSMSSAIPSGEIAAAYALTHLTSGCWTIAYWRGMRALQLKRTLKKAAMCFIAVSEEEAKNISGLTCRIDAGGLHEQPQVRHTFSFKGHASIMARTRDCKIFLQSDPFICYHTQHMHHIKEEYLEDLEGFPAATHYDGCVMSHLSRARQVFVSEMMPNYRVDNLVSPVHFSEATRAMVVEAQPDMIMGWSPHATLKTPLEDILSSLPPSSSSFYASAMLREGNDHWTLLNLIR